MENSSKALIIAGAIVISILIIGLGMYFYNIGSSNTKGIKMSDYEKTQINTKFSAYEGKLNSNKALELLETVVAYNNSVGENGYGMLMYFSNNSKEPNNCSFMGSDNEIVRKLYNEESYDVVGFAGIINRDSGMIDPSESYLNLKLNKTTGFKINKAMYNVNKDNSLGLDFVNRNYYNVMKEELSDKTREYVGFSYYQKETGIIRAMVVYQCNKYNN